MITEKPKGINYFIDAENYTREQSELMYAQVLMLIGEFELAFEQLSAYPAQALLLRLALRQLKLLNEEQDEHILRVAFKLDSLTDAVLLIMLCEDSGNKLDALCYWIIKHKKYELLLETKPNLVIEFDKDTSVSFRDLVSGNFTRVIRKVARQLEE
jgi:hypothetical protein